MTRWLTGAVLMTMAILPAPPARAQDDDYTLEFVYTLLTKRSVLERELEFKFDYEKGSGLKLEIPVVLQSPNERPNQNGTGDLELTNRFLLYKGLTGEGRVEPLPNAQFSILPGFNVQPLPGMTVAVGVEVPLTSTKAVDYVVRTLLVCEF